MGRKAKVRADGEAIALGKQEIINLWESLDESTTPFLEPLPIGHEGTSYLSDTIRLTGSRESIESILGRLKPLLDLDGTGSRLTLTLKQTVDRVSGELTPAWACYIKAHARSGNGPGRPPGSRSVKMSVAGQNGHTENVTAPQRQLEGPPSKEVDPEIFLKNMRKANEKLPPDRRATIVPPPTDGPVQGPRPKGYRKPKTTPSTAPPASVKSTDSEPVYGIGVRDGDGWTWTEPSEVDDYPCDTYPDMISCGDAIASLKRGKHGSKDAMEVVEFVKVGGKVRINPIA